MKNAVKRRRLGNLWNYIVHGRAINWTSLAASLLSRAVHHGGVFHLWGHSWELQETEQWERLEQVMFNMRQWTDTIPCLTNGEIIARVTEGDRMTRGGVSAGEQPMQRVT